MFIYPDYIIEFIKKCLNSRGQYVERYAQKAMTKEVNAFLVKENVTPHCLCLMYKNNLTEVPRCLTCGKPLNTFHHGRKYCNKSCINRAISLEKSKQTNLQKYGVENPSQNEEIKEKTRNTNLQRYSHEHPSQAKEVKEKIRKTNYEKYGRENVFSNKEVQEKIKESLLQKYGAENPSQVKDIQKKKQITHRNHYYEKFVLMMKNKNITVLSSKEEYIEGNFIFQCDKCNEIFTSSFTNPREICCPKHTSHYSKVSSKAEKEIVSFVKEFGFEVIENTKKLIDNYEIDIFIPEKKVAIEFNGSYWHSDKFVNKNYHLEKTEKCQEKGIRLIHIFEWEWNRKKEICQSIIASSLGIYKRKIYARNCLVKEIDKNMYKNFLEINHLQGSINSYARYGLFYENELVSVIGFRNNLLQRYCSLLHTQIIGGLSKLIKHSKRKNFYSYIDLTHFDGKGYERCGFSLMYKVSPKYVYVYGKNIIKNIKKIECNNYSRVYNCGFLKVSYTI